MVALMIQGMHTWAFDSISRVASRTRPTHCPYARCCYIKTNDPFKAGDYRATVDIFLTEVPCPSCVKRKRWVCMQITLTVHSSQLPYMVSVSALIAYVYALKHSFGLSHSILPSKLNVKVTTVLCNKISAHRYLQDTRSSSLSDLHQGPTPHPACRCLHSHMHISPLADQ